MNDFSAPLFESFETFSRTLAELEGKNLEERSIQAIFVLTQQIAEIGDRCTEFRALMQKQELSEKAKLCDRSFELKKVQGQLDRLISACQGKSSYAVKDLQALIWTWKRDFQELVAGIARSEQHRRVKAKPTDLLLRLQNLQNEVFNSACENEFKLTLLKQLMSLESGLQSLEKPLAAGEMEWEAVDDRCQEIEEKLTAIAAALQQAQS